MQKDKQVATRRVTVAVALGGLVAAMPQHAGAKISAPPPPPVSILPSAPSPVPTVPDVPSPVPAPAVLVPSPVPVAHWTPVDATALLTVIEGVGKRGLFAADYAPAGLRAAIAAGEGLALDSLASRLFIQLALDLRDGRTPAAARVQWLVKDSDATTLPIEGLLQLAVTSHNVEAVLASTEPQSPDYAALKATLAKTPATDKARVALIRANMDRWRWLPRSLGPKHLLANVPEYMLRVNIFGKTIASYRVIVGKKDTATPQLSANAIGIVVHPPWVLPRSIITQEVGPLIARSPATAKARGYTWTGSGKTLSVVQQPGPSAALGLLKIDMPNPDAIFIHDTPNRTLFANHPRAYSHGCLRTERAFELGILLGILQSGESMEDAAARDRVAEELVTLIKLGKTEKVPFKDPIPVFISYFTLATGMDGKLQTYVDVYGRDAPVFASFDQPRVEKKIPELPAFVVAPIPVL